VEEDGAVASAGISGQDEGFVDESVIVDSPEPLEVLNQVPSETSATVKRKYHDSYLDIGFIETSDKKPQCVICGKVLPNSSMFPAKLRLHFEGVHPDCKDKLSDFFRRKYGELTKAQKIIFYHSKTVNENALMVSYLVSYRVAQAGEAHTITENFIKPCVKDIVECMLDGKAVEIVGTVHLSNNTISRQIGDLAEDVKAPLLSRIKCTKFSLQMDESTDVAGLAILTFNIRTFKCRAPLCRQNLNAL